MLLAACGSAGDDVQRAPPPVEDTVFGDAVSTMDQAHGVQDTLMQDKQQLDSAIEEQSAGADRPANR